MFTLKLNDPKILNNTIGTIAEFISDATFQITNEGLKLVAMDPANISMVILTILPSAFTEYQVNEPSKITINLDGFRQALRRVRAGESITLTHSANKLNITITGTSTKRFSIPLLEDEEVERKIPELDFKVKIEMDSKEFRDFVDDASIVSEAVGLKAAENLLILTAGDTGRKVDIELAKGSSALVSMNIKEPASSIYSVEYLKKMSKAASFADSVKVNFSSEYPLRLDFKALNQAQMSFILAPRIENK